MMKNIKYIVITLSLFISSCTDFLDESPSRTDNNPIETLEDLDLLINDPGGFDRGFWNKLILASDDAWVSPDINKLFNYTIASDMVPLSIWDKDYFESGFEYSGDDWGSMGRYLYKYNTVLSYIDEVSGDDENLRKQIKAEAFAARAYFHFYMAVEYCLHPSINKGQEKGIGYRMSDNPKDAIERHTVEYTFNKIKEDIEQAEKLFKEIGRTGYDANSPTNFRFNYISLMAFKARLNLYEGDYVGAYSAATIALKAHSQLTDIASDPLFETDFLSVAKGDDVIQQRYFINQDAENKAGTLEDKELYMPHVTTVFSVYSILKTLPPSQELYNLYDNKDQRKIKFYDNNFNVSVAGVSQIDDLKSFDGSLMSKGYQKYGYLFFSVVPIPTFSLSPTTAEMLLIQAECIARGEVAGNAQQKLQQLRRNRFADADIAAANKIGGTMQDVMDERRREMPFVMRWYDLKRYNALDNANINISKNVEAFPYTKGKEIKTYELKANDPFYALPIPLRELTVLGWEQN